MNAQAALSPENKYWVEPGNPERLIDCDGIIIERPPIYYDEMKDRGFTDEYPAPAEKIEVVDGNWQPRTIPEDEQAIINEEFPPEQTYIERRYKVDCWIAQIHEKGKALTGVAIIRTSPVQQVDELEEKTTASHEFEQALVHLVRGIGSIARIGRLSHFKDENHLEAA